MKSNSVEKKPLGKRRLWLLFAGAAGAAILLAVLFFALALTVHPHRVPVYGDDDYVVTLPIDKEQLVVLNLTDIQLCDLEDLRHLPTLLDEIDELVGRAHPDLITLTGDMVWSNENNLCLHALLRRLDSYGIPFAPVIGNHDLGNDPGGATASGDYFSYLLERCENCLFRHGPREAGVGNYVVRVMRGEKLVRVLYFMDAGYRDEISKAQKDWFLENALALEGEFGSAEGALFLHKPLDEYADAYYAYRRGDGAVGAIGDVYVTCSLSGVESGDFFDLIKAHGVTDVVCGHQHTNAFTLSYEGVRLTFGLKTGETSFYYDDGQINLNGGTVLVFSPEGTDVSLLTVDRDKYHIKGSQNICD